MRRLCNRAYTESPGTRRYILIYGLFELFTVELHFVEVRNLFVAAGPSERALQSSRAQMFSLQFLTFDLFPLASRIVHHGEKNC